MSNQRGEYALLRDGSQALIRALAPDDRPQVVKLVEAATLLTHQPLPAGNSVGILSNTGGLATLCADACIANGLRIPSLCAETEAALRLLLPAESAPAAAKNPVVLQMALSAATYGAALHHLLDAAVDAAIVLVTPPVATSDADVAAALLAACGSPPGKPVLTCVLGVQGVPQALHGRAVIPSYTFPEAAARALGHAAAHAAWLRRPAGEIPTFADINAHAARAVVARALQRAESLWLAPQRHYVIRRVDASCTLCVRYQVGQTYPGVQEGAARVSGARSQKNT